MRSNTEIPLRCRSFGGDLGAIRARLMAGLGGRRACRASTAMHTNMQTDHRRPVAAEQTAAQATFSASSSDDDERVQLIAFCSGGERYAVDILEVQQIASLSQATPGTLGAGPHSERVAFMLRGEMVPILDLRLRGRPT